MKVMQTTLLVVLCGVSVAHQAKENPLGQVIALLDSLAAKITAAGEAEAKAYKEYIAWCGEASQNKGFEIKTATSKKEDLEATISKSAADIGASASKIEGLAASISTSEGELKDATTVRSKESEDFSASEAELVDAIDTLGRAVNLIDREMAKNPSAFAQVDSKNMDSLVKALGVVTDAAAISSTDRSKLMALVQSQQNADADDEELGAPAASTYKSHSSSILDVLEDMKEKAEGQLSDLRKAEVATKHNYEMLRQSLEDQTAADTKDFDEEKSSKAASEGTKATAEGDLSRTEQDLADAKAALEEANSNCMQVASDHEATTQARNGELAAVAKAKEVLGSTTGGAVEQSYSLIQMGSLLQTRADLANVEVVTLVKKLAREHHSAALAQLASRIAAVLRYGASAGEDPFTKVKTLIGDLITKLENEAGEDASEKAYCDEETAKTQAKKEQLEADIAKLTSKIDQAAASAAKLKEEVKELSADLAQTASQQAEMDKIRRESHADFVQAKADLEQGLGGVRKALGVLRDYYGGAAASMLQGDGNVASMMQQPARPEVHEKSAGAGNSIIGILEVVESDFAKNLATEETQEADAQSEYDKTTQTNKISKTLKDQDVKYKNQEIKSLAKSISELKSDRSTSSEEQSAVLEYFAKINERCIAKPETYEDRRSRRQAEISGLKEALQILEGETAFVQRRKRGLKAAFLGVH